MKSVCKVTECSSFVKSNGLCSKHAHRMSRYQDVNLVKNVRRKALVSEGKSYCSSCKETKEIPCFSKDRSDLYGISTSCKECQKIVHRKSNYGITKQEYNDLLNAQNQLCAICKGPQQRNGVALAVDHDHETKEIRGLLCDNCNRAIGFLKENLSVLEESIRYLKRFNKINDKWDLRFLEQAREISQYSYDPSTKVGAIVTDGKQRISSGYNGFPERIKDLAERYQDRDLKLKLITHAEVNAIFPQDRQLTGMSVYTYPFPPCAKCAGIIITAGIKRVVSFIDDYNNERWKEDFNIGEMMYKEAHITLDLYESKTNKMHNIVGEYNWEWDHWNE